MDCPYIITIETDMENPHLAWLKENNITRFRYDLNRYGLRFRFENDQDKVYFALRWA